MRPPDPTDGGTRPARDWRAWSTSLKGRLSVAIVAGVLSSVAVVAVARGAGAGWPVSSATGIAVALSVVQVLARGTTRPLRELASAARRMASGDWSARVGTSGVREIAQLQQAFNDMASELAEVDRFRRDLVANASHELRTPISVLRASLENIADGVVKPDPEHLAVLLGQVDRLSHLTEQLLDLSLLESGNVELRAEPFTVAPLLQRTADALSLRADDRRITVSVDGDPVVVGDELRIEQVVTNLADNAMRHAPAGSEVELHADAPPGWVRIHVADHGPGIPPEEVARVFERFHRVDAARRSADGGAGLGLSIVRWIVDLHGGRIDVLPNDPAPGRGVDGDAPGRAGAGGTGEGPTGQGCRIVVWLPGVAAGGD